MFEHAPPHEREQVLRFVAAIILNAQRKAEMTIEMLKNLGYPVQSKRVPVDLSTFKIPRGPEAEWLSNLGAALQVGSWERAGLLEQLPENTVPSFSAAVRQLAPGHGANAADPEEAPGDLNRQVLQAWLAHFALAAQSSLGVDIVVKKDNLPADDLLEALADLLWEHRGRMRSPTTPG
jgi:hypothetical protein